MQKYMFSFFCLITSASLLLPQAIYADNQGVNVEESKYFLLKNKASGLCADNLGWGNRKVVSWTCKRDQEGNWNQQWFLRLTSPGYYQLVSASSHNHCVTVDIDASLGRSVSLEECLGVSENGTISAASTPPFHFQHWQLIQKNSGKFVFRNATRLVLAGSALGEALKFANEEASSAAFYIYPFKQAETLEDIFYSDN